MRQRIMKIILAFVLSFISNTEPCGVITHIEIGYRASQYFKDDSSVKVDYAKLIQKHTDALLGGSPYPDAYYPDECEKGQYHDVSEDTHWAPFLNVTVNYIRKNYPQPWDEATEKLVVFMFGVVSHQVADIAWHSLGIEQGFLATMGDINFHGSFDAAHSVGDIGGDILTGYEFNTSYVPYFEGWYIPTEDLVNIYTEYYHSSSKMPRNAIVTCTEILYLSRLGELLAIQELYADYSKKSPFMVDQFEDYFLGGINDMVGWTNRIWQETVTMLEDGTQQCNIPKSTMFVQCNATVSRRYGDPYPKGRGLYRKPILKGVSSDDLTVEKVLRGVKVKPSKQFWEKLRKKQMKRKSRLEKTKRSAATGRAGPPRYPDRILYVRNEYAQLGAKFAHGDLNFDGKQDLVITAPQYGTPGSPQEGRVYIIYGDDNGLPTGLNPDLDQLEVTGQGQIIKGWGTAQSRFGSSVAVVDINLDGADDIAIGAPALVNAGTSPLGYHGSIMVYFGQPSQRNVARGAANITLACDKIQYCNLGFSMTSADVNNDGHPDLVFGSPFYPGGGEQRGIIAVLLASLDNTGYQYMEISQLQFQRTGDQDYGWFGYNIVSAPWVNGPALFVSQPEYRKCAMKNCSYSDKDVQATGNLMMFTSKGGWVNLPTLDPEEFAQQGWGLDVGSPYPDQGTLVMAVARPGDNVQGSIGGLDYVFDQAGSVLLFNVTKNQSLTPLKYRLEGDRTVEHFGSVVKFLDVNQDGLSDLVVGAPKRTDDITEELLIGDEGQVYVYFGGRDFPFDPSLADCGNSLVRPCPRLQASLTLEWGGDSMLSRFGSNFAVMKGTKKGAQLLVTAEHASDYARLAGAVGVFDF